MRRIVFRNKIFVAVVIAHVIALAAVFGVFSFDWLYGQKPQASTQVAAVAASVGAEQPSGPQGNATSAASQEGKAAVVAPKAKKSLAQKKAMPVEKQKEAKRNTAATKS